MKSIRVAQLLLLSLTVGQSLATCGSLSASGKKLIAAAKDDHPAEVAQLLRQGVDPDTCDQDGYTALHWAAWYGYDDVAQVLLNGGASPNVRDKDKRTPLHWAARNGKSTDVVETLINEDADVEAVDKDTWTALHWAAWYGYVDIVQALLDGGANTEARDKDQWTPLHVAVRSDISNADTVDTLLNGGAKVNALDKYQWTPLHWAAYYDRVEDAKVLLRHDADTTLRGYQGRTPLGVAEYNNKPGVAQLLSR